MTERPIEQEMQLLWDRLDVVCETFESLVESLVGGKRGFTLMIHPSKPEYATLSVTNLKSNLEAVREWVAQMDARKPETGL